MTAQRRTLYLWIALLAILFGTVAPTVSRTLAADLQFAAGSICVTDGSGKAPAGDLAACAYCLPHGGSHALLPDAGFGIAVIGGHDLYHAQTTLAPVPHLSWQHGLARGPPVLS
ncbi:DUF2946 family protein [Duganella qianjiadongensis]|uniref:DUF2946 domain-containing protein n=1 Tax=Duganella qianjiadongensis TaxID=2692176 RepID=A0ABW9VJ56_9BURK|nr:DUF2946 family protein [Duganella qianjiadongensis]MYM39530.1 DUF2946 domain-containing protein [Duganella qianjiadongensis]